LKNKFLAATTVAYEQEAMALMVLLMVKNGGG